jgi:hypothetical protein
MPATYEPIATTTLGSAGTITFTSIPSTYTDLILVVNGTAASGELSLRFNGSSATDYSSTVLEGTGASGGSRRFTSSNRMRLGFYGYFFSTEPSLGTAHIFNYANTTTFKTVLASEGNADSDVNAIDYTVGLWRSTSAITSIQALAGTGNFNTGTTATLYGIKSA